MTGSSDGIYAAYLSGRSGSGFAIYATWRAPIAAAQLAEQLRRAADRDQERQRHKRHLFATLMQERAAFYTENGVRARNLIDVVFSDAREVRDAWTELFHSLDPVQKAPWRAQMEKLRALLAAMARNIGLADDLRVEDLTRVYLPTALAQARFIRDMERRQAVIKLQSETQPQANTAPPQITPWPPAPT